MALLVLLLSLPLSSLSAQSSWDSFDQTLRQLKQEIELLSYQIASTQSSLTASQDELAKLKKLLQEREIQYQESVASWTRLNESLKTSESSLRKTKGWLIGSVAVNLVIIAVGCFAIF